MTRKAGLNAADQRFGLLALAFLRDLWSGVAPLVEPRNRIIGRQVES